MFADLHHLHHFMSLDQGGHITSISVPGGQIGEGPNDIYFGNDLTVNESFGSTFLNLALQELRI